MRPMRFKVERLLEGHNYGYWASGGYDPEKKRGQFWIAVGQKGEPLKEIQRMREMNGRHVLNLVYPGCYILQAVCNDPPVIDMDFFQIKEIDQEAGEAVCDRIMEEDMTQRQYDRMVPCMDLARMECITPYNQNNHYYWRRRDE